MARRIVGEGGRRTRGYRCGAAEGARWTAVQVAQGVPGGWTHLQSVYPMPTPTPQPRPTIDERADGEPAEAVGGQHTTPPTVRPMRGVTRRKSRISGECERTWGLVRHARNRIIAASPPASVPYASLSTVFSMHVSQVCATCDRWCERGGAVNHGRVAPLAARPSPRGDARAP